MESNESYMEPWDQPQEPQQPMMQPNGQPHLDIPMKWHKFLIYFSLWLGAAFNIMTAVSMLSGMIYGDRTTAHLVYNTFRGLHAVDLVYGLCLLALAVYMIMTRYALARFRRKGPKMLVNMYLIVLIITVVYGVLASVIIHSAAAMTQIVSGVTSSVIMIAVNNIYYKKRMALFVYD